MTVVVAVDVGVAAPVIVAVHLNGNAPVVVIARGLDSRPSLVRTGYIGNKTHRTHG